MIWTAIMSIPIAKKQLSNEYGSVSLPYASRGIVVDIRRKVYGLIAAAVRSNGSKVRKYSALVDDINQDSSVDSATIYAHMSDGTSVDVLRCEAEKTYLDDELYNAITLNKLLHRHKAKDDEDESTPVQQNASVKPAGNTPPWGNWSQPTPAPQSAPPLVDTNLQYVTSVLDYGLTRYGDPKVRDVYSYLRYLQRIVNSAKSRDAFYKCMLPGQPVNLATLIDINHHTKFYALLMVIIVPNVIV